MSNTERGGQAADVPAGIGPAELRGRRRGLGLTQAALGSALGVSGNTVARWERGAHAIGEPILVQLALERLERAPPLPVPGPALPSERRHNVPALLTVFVGRERELDEVERLLATGTGPGSAVAVHGTGEDDASSGPRLVTLTGPGGVGKTRLALEVAGRLAADPTTYPDGVWIADLAPLARADLVAPAVAAVLGVAERPGQALADALAAYLAARRLLVVVDNCEHLLRPSARLVEALLQAAPGVRVLATSRAPLGVPGEQRWPVAPLGLPPVGRPATVEAVGRADATRLLAERARLVRPDFAVTPATATAVATICRRLDGLPLAIELVAPHLRVLTVAELAVGLDDRLRFTAGGGRATLPRHRTLRGALDWSYGLLAPADRALLRRLGVFAAGWTRAAAEAICVDDGAARAAVGTSVVKGNVLPLLTRLVDASLVVAEPIGGADVDATDAQPAVGAAAVSGDERLATAMRYRLLETVRDYALERLEGVGEAAALRSRHAAHFLAIAEQAAQAAVKDGGSRTAALDRLQADHDQLREALAWTLRSGEAGTRRLGLRSVAALWRFWELRGHLTEGRRWLDRALAAETLSPDAAPEAVGNVQAAAVRAELFHGAGVLAWRQGDYTAARERLDTALAMRRVIFDRSGEAAALDALSSLAWSRGDHAEARSYAEAALATFRALGDRAGAEAALHTLAGVAQAGGDYAGARSLHETGLAMARELGDPTGVVSALNHVGDVAIEQGDLEVAQARCTESLALARVVGDTWRTSVALQVLGDVALRRGDYARAEALLEECLTLRRTLDARGGLATVLNMLGGIAREAGDLAKAGALHAESLTIRRELGNRAGIAWSLDAIARVQAARGGAAPAAWLFAAAHATRETAGLSLAPVDQAAQARDVAAVRAQLTSPAFDAAWAAGRSAPLVVAVRYAQAAATTSPAALGGPFSAAPLTQKQAVHSPTVTSASAWTARARGAGLTPRETEVLSRLAAGRSNREIAAELVVSARTVEHHLANIYGKLGVRGRLEAVAVVLRQTGEPAHEH